MTNVSRRGFLASTAIAATTAKLAAADQHTAELDGFALARPHTITHDEATPNFFEGMLLGNGDIGLCLTVRPDALGLHLGKEDSWDIRVSEESDRHVLPFKELLQLWQRASDEAKRQGHPDMTYLESKIDFFRQYTETVTASYRKTWPRPWPCGIVWIHWDPRRLHVARQSLDPSNGLFRLELASDSGPVHLSCFVNTVSNHVCVFSDRAALFSSITYYPNLDKSAELPAPQMSVQSGENTAVFEAFQVFPATAPTAEAPNSQPSDKARNFALHAIVQGKWQVAPDDETHLALKSGATAPFRLDLALMTPRDHSDSQRAAQEEAQQASRRPAAELLQKSEEFWRDYWSRSAVELRDKELERLWYHNQYWLGCCLRQGKVAPGLFGNWTSGKIGTAWHGDYHMNYNTQQVFWGVFSSNHADQHFPYIELCENLLPLGEAYAKDKFELPGAFFPHSAYPVPSKTIAYPAPPWGYEVCETPWTVQSLWWHYLYTQDEAVLRRVYPLMRAASRFLTAYLKKENDGKYHVIPTVSPENWGFTVDQRLNQDCIMDLALTRFTLNATAKASQLLHQEDQEREHWLEIAGHLADYPTIEGPQGEVWIDVKNAPAEWIYNIPVTLAPVFPGEQVGLDLGAQHHAIANRTTDTIRLEGGNDLVFLPLIRARLGTLDLDWFRRQVRYCLLPNGVAQDRVRQTGGRYSDTTDFDFMMRMGIWTENLSLPVVVNECLLQSYAGVIRLFPNTTNLGPAKFDKLRAVGAFLVSAAWDGKQISGVEILSEKGAPCRLAPPWPSAIAVTEITSAKRVTTQKDGNYVRFPTESGRRYAVKPAV
jgi:hypothetical protein